MKEQAEENMVLTNEMQVFYCFCGFIFKEKNAEILLYKTNETGVNYLKKVAKSSPVFRRSFLFPLSLAFGAFTALLSKSFGSS